MTHSDRPPAGIPAPRDDLIRRAPAVRPVEGRNAAVRLRDADDTDVEDTPLGTMVGYPVVYDVATEIDSWFEGRFRETVDPGALDKTLKQRGDQVKVLFNHGMDSHIGDAPLGRATIQQSDERGLWVEVPLSDTDYNRDRIAPLLRDGALDGMSFRFSVVKELWDDDPEDGGLPTRTLLEVKLYEYGPVTFPAYEATSVGIRSRAEYAAWRSGDRATRAVMLSALGAPQDAVEALDTPQTPPDEPPDPGHTPNTTRTDLDADARAKARDATVAQLRARVAAYSG